MLEITAPVFKSKFSYFVFSVVVFCATINIGTKNININIKTKDMKRLKSKKLINVGLLLAIDRMYTIFYTKPQTYFNVEYTIEDLTMHTHLAEYMIHPFEDILIENIISNTLMEDDILSNIIIKYFNNTPLNEDDIENIRYIYMKKSSKLFYYIPCVLFIIEQTIKTIMSKKEM